LLQDYNIDGLRIDTVPYINKRYWAQWKSQAAGSVFSMGEIFDARTDYVAGYANIIGSTLSYPLFFVLRDVFTKKTSMYNIRSMLEAYKRDFSDPTGLGVFIDNHDIARFLHFTQDYKLYQNALTYVSFAEGITLIYYGTEQAFSGGNDPENREPLWTTNYNTNSYFYKLIKTMLTFKNSVIKEIATSPQIERYAADNFYAFSRGKAMVLTTNAGSNGGRVQYTITYHPYADGTVICNIFYPTDCVTVQNKSFQAVLLDGESKVFYPKQ
jgi:alpha-amylase